MGGHAIHNPNVGVKWRQNLPASKTLLWDWSSGVCGTSPTPQTEISLVFLEEDSHRTGSSEGFEDLLAVHDAVLAEQDKMNHIIEIDQSKYMRCPYIRV